MIEPGADQPSNRGAPPAGPLDRAPPPGPLDQARTDRRAAREIASPERREFLGACARGAVVLGAGLALPDLLRAQDAPAGGAPVEAAAPSGRGARYAARDFSALKGLKGISDGQLAVHLELYAGYVRRTNALLEALDSARAAADAGAAVQELRRRLGWEWNGMRLHELYFENLAPDAGALPADHPLAAAAIRTHGSVEAWQTDLLNTCKMPGFGWAIVTQDGDRLLNGWVEEHHEGHLAGARPLLVLDLWEHAWTVDRKPTERAGYLEALFQNVAWPVVARRMAA